MQLPFHVSCRLQSVCVYVCEKLIKSDFIIKHNFLKLLKADGYASKLF